MVDRVETVTSDDKAGTAEVIRDQGIAAVMDLSGDKAMSKAIPTQN